MAPFQLSDFNSYLQLLVAFTFAYGGVQTFREFINKSSVKEFPDKIKVFAEKVKKSNSGLQTMQVVNSHSKKTKDFLQEKINKLQNKFDELDNIKTVGLSIYDGNRFEAMFFVVGIVYIFYLLLGGLQRYLGNTTIFICITFVTIAMYLFLGLSYTQIRMASRFEKHLDKNRCKNTKFMIKCFLGLCIFSFFSSCESSHLFQDYVFSSKEENKILSMMRGEFGHFIYLGEVLSISIIPYLIYYKREKLFLNKIVEKFQTEEVIFNDIHNDIEQVQSVAQNSILKTPEKRLLSISALLRK